MKTIGQIVVTIVTALFLATCIYGGLDLISTVHALFVKGRALGFIPGVAAGLSYYVWKFIKELEQRS